MVELVDTPDLGSGAVRCGGSSPFARKPCGNSSAVEHLLAKEGVAGSNPVSRSLQTREGLEEAIKKESMNMRAGYPAFLISASLLPFKESGYT